jgi:hypothetical protein
MRYYGYYAAQWRGATSAEIATSAELIKQTFPGTKVMMVEAGPEITPTLSIPASADWVGFDWYCQPFTTTEQKLATLQPLLPAGSGQRIFLLPENAPLSACAGASSLPLTVDANERVAARILAAARA